MLYAECPFLARLTEGRMFPWICCWALKIVSRSLPISTSQASETCDLLPGDRNRVS